MPPRVIQIKGRMARIYETASGYQVAYYDDHGKRRLLNRKTKEAAEEAARTALGKKTDLEALQRLSPVQLQHLMAIRDMLPAQDRNFSIAITNLRLALQTVDPSRMVEAVQFWKRKVGTSSKDCTHTAKDVLDALLHEREHVRQGRGTSKRNLDDLRSRLGRFSDRFRGPLAMVTGQEVETWLLGLTDAQGRPLSARTRNNYRTAINVLVQFAKRKGWIPKSWDEMDVVERETLPLRQPEVFTPDQARALLDACIPSVRAYVILGLYGFVRRSEVVEHRLDWSNVDLEAGQVYIPGGPGGSKTWQDRFIPLQPIALELLRGEASSGPICPAHPTPALRKAAASAGLSWSQNVLRDSCISHALPLWGPDKVSGWAGNSPDQIRRQYRKPLPEGQARAYWCIGDD